MATVFTQHDAETLAASDPNYVAKRIRKRDGQSDRWGVWDTISDHWVEFDFAPAVELGYRPNATSSPLNHNPNDEFGWKD